MAIILILRVALLVCILLGGLFAILATAGKEWQKFEQQFSYRYDNPIVIKKKYYAGLWEFCYARAILYRLRTICAPVNSQSQLLKGSIIEKLHTTRAFMIIGILQYGAAFLLLALAQLLKKDILQKIVAPIFWSILSCGIIAMSCGTSLVNELHDYDKQISVFPRGPYSYGWSYGIGWASVAIALIGSIISTIGLFQLPRDAGNPIMSSTATVTLL